MPAGRLAGLGATPACHHWLPGKNTLGQLGDGSTHPRLTPVQVMGLTTVAQMAAGLEFAVARLADGTIRAWGANATTRLGDLSGGFSAVPVVVPALADVAAIAAGRRHALAVDGDGRTWGWGANTNSQLGTPTYVGASGSGAPQRLPGGTAGIAAAAGWQHTLVLRADGSVWATGALKANGLGGAQVDELTPIPNLSLDSNAWLVIPGDPSGAIAATHSGTDITTTGFTGHPSEACICGTLDALVDATGNRRTWERNSSIASLAGCGWTASPTNCRHAARRAGSTRR